MLGPVSALQSTRYHGSRKLAREDLLPPEERCPVCGARGSRALVQRLQDDPEVDLLRCDACGACSAARMPTPDLLERYYAGYYREGGEKATFHDVGLLARHVWRALDPAALGARLRVLDFGGGEGALSRHLAGLHRAARDDGHTSIALVDFERTPAARGEGWTLEQVRTLEEAPGAFDVVLASSILEHVPALGEVLRALFARVARPGFFYARTPFIEPFCRLSRRVDVTYPGHVHDLGERFWSRVVATFGLRGARLVVSRPSPVETRLRDAPLRTLAAHALKLPAFLEARLRAPAATPRLWTLVGGWEVVLRFDPLPGPPDGGPA